MRYNVLLGGGIVIYALMSLLWSGFVTYGFLEGLAPRIVGLLALIAISILAGRFLRLHSWSDILPYSISWAVMIALLDAVFSVPYTGWQLYLDWNVWFGYAVVAIAPLFSPYFHFNRTRTQPPQV